jgi:hypothetical protein
MKAIKLLVGVACALVFLASGPAAFAESCCVKAKAAGKDCTMDCCVAAHKDKKACDKCQADASCCDKAIAKGEACAHPCCADAAKAGKVCEKCNPPKKVKDSA